MGGAYGRLSAILLGAASSVLPIVNENQGSGIPSRTWRFEAANSGILTMGPCNPDAVVGAMVRPASLECLSLGYFREFRMLIDELTGVKTTRGGIARELCALADGIANGSAICWEDSVSPLRRKVLDYCRENFQFHPFMKSPLVPVGLRICHFLRTKEDFPGWLEDWGLDDSASLSLTRLYGQIREIESSPAMQLVKTRNGMPDSAASMSLLLRKVAGAPVLMVRLSCYMRLLPLVERLLGAPYLLAGCQRYAFLNEMKPALAPRVDLPVNATAFFHRLRTVLLDAIWVDDPTTLATLDYIFRGEKIVVSRADSALIVAVIQAFSERNRHLRFRVDRTDTTGAGAARMQQLNDAVKRTMVEIRNRMSEGLFSYLDSVPEQEVLLSIDPVVYPEVFCLGTYGKVIREISASVGRGTARFGSYWPTELLLPEPLPEQTGGKDARAFDRRLNEYVGACEPACFNYFVLSLCKYFIYNFRGSSSIWEEAICEKGCLQ